MRLEYVINGFVSILQETMHARKDYPLNNCLLIFDSDHCRPYNYEYEHNQVKE